MQYHFINHNVFSLWMRQNWYSHTAANYINGSARLSIYLCYLALLLDKTELFPSLYIHRKSMVECTELWASEHNMEGDVLWVNSVSVHCTWCCKQSCIWDTAMMYRSLMKPLQQCIFYIKVGVIMGWYIQWNITEFLLWLVRNALFGVIGALHKDYYYEIDAISLWSYNPRWTWHRIHG